MTAPNLSATEAPAANLVAALSDEALPFCSGIIKLSPRALVLYYGKPGEPGRIDFMKDRDVSELDKLEKACEPATFGRNQEDVLDESYRKAGKLDTEHFALGFDAAASGLMDAVRIGLLRHDEQRPVVADLYKLNVYGKGAFFKAHQDTPRAANMFGSLVVALPAPHEGGQLLLRHGSQEWTFDSAKIFADLGPDASAHIAFVAFYSDVEHEVLPVLSGHRVTVTWNLYYGDKADVRMPASGLRMLEPQSTNASNIQGALEVLLANRNMLQDGGLLGFGLRYEYPIDAKEPRCLEHLPRWLKGSDDALFFACKTLGLRPALRFVVLTEGVYAMCKRPLDVNRWDTAMEPCDLAQDILYNCKGVRLRYPWARLEHACNPAAFARARAETLRRGRYLEDGDWHSIGSDDSDYDAEERGEYFGNGEDDGDDEDREGSEGGSWREDSSEIHTADAEEGDEDQEGCDKTEGCNQGSRARQTVYWVTKRKGGTSHGTPYISYGNEAVMDYIYSSVCLVAEVPPATQRVEIDRV